MDYELSALLPSNSNDSNQLSNSTVLDSKMSLSTLITKKAEQHLQNHLPNILNGNNPSQKAGQVSGWVKSSHESSSIYMDTTRLLVSLLHAWNLDENIDLICLKNLKLLKPKISISYGCISRKGKYF